MFRLTMAILIAAWLAGMAISVIELWPQVKPACDAECRFSRAAQQICGINAAGEKVGDSLQCFSHTGRKTAKVTQ